MLHRYKELSWSSGNPKTSETWRKVALFFIICAFLYASYIMLLDQILLLALTGVTSAALLPERHATSCSSSEKVPQYFQTSPELWAGPTATGKAPFLAQTNPVSFAPTVTYVPNTPLETGEPIVGQGQNGSIFHLMAQLSPYFPNPSGFGVAEYPLPPGAKIAQLQKVANNTGKFNATGALSFLNDWKYQLGYEILVPRGRQELFESGILHYYQYAQLYNPYSKIIARTTTQDRMLKSAEYFMAGFFGLEWTNNVTIEVIIEQNGYNNSLAGYDNCPNSNNYRSAGGNNASLEWVSIYLQDATERFQALISPEFNWTVTDTYAAQTIVFCDLFTYSEWEGFEYALDLYFAGGSSFASPTGRAVGIGYQQEMIARLQNHTLGYSGSQINTTLDNNTVTFPLNQSIYFDFSHDTNIMSILTAFGFTQFAEPLPATRYPGAHNLTVSHLEPFAARLDVEVIKTPKPLNADRTYGSGGETTYIHFILNQRTLPLGFSFPECGADRLDGWCELETFLKVQSTKTEEAQYDYSCFGDYPAEPYGGVTNGVPSS
ncbi:histidine acid phosphatase protein [Rutstroemia sp. NJR-2017a WRK4]|nr:histidine acid phosphatase protein [Rutstroemia sp. NJR-2017a WRK4]